MGWLSKHWKKLVSVVGGAALIVTGIVTANPALTATGGGLVGLPLPWDSLGQMLGLAPSKGGK